MARSISEIGLLNPITIDQEHILIAGLHRLEAAKRLGWTEIECNVCALDALDCRQSPEAFILEYSAFIERVQRGMESFRLSNYEESLPALSQEQLHTLIGLTDSCRKTLEDYLGFVKEARANV